MKYFRDILGKITKGTTQIIKLSKSVSFNRSKNSDYLIEYYIKDGDTPESMALDLYGDYDFWWVIMVTSGNVDRFSDWPMTDMELNEYIDWLIVEGEIAGSASEIQEIKDENDAKRIINILDPKYINDFIYKIEQIYR